MKEPKQNARYAYDGLERVIHEKARLSIMSSLASNASGLTFNDLKDLCALTDGNLSRHLALLQEAHLIAIEKGYANNRPQTQVTLTKEGRKRFVEYVTELERVVKDALQPGKTTRPGANPGLAH